MMKNNVLLTILDRRIIEEAVIIPVHDDIVEFGWLNPIVFEVMNAIIDNNKLLIGIDIWLVENKQEYVLNSVNDIILSGIGWSYSRDKAMTENYDSALNFINTKNKELVNYKILFNFTIE